MSIRNKELRSLADNWTRDEHGNMSMIMGLSALVILMATTASIDINNLTRQKQQAQALADTMALAASIAVDQDNEDRFVEGQEYTYQQVTGVYKRSAAGMLGSIDYDVVDEFDAGNEGKPEDKKTRLLARATVNGVYKSAFAGVFPNHNKFAYTVTSDVAYSRTGGKPASVFFAVDNSGSMGWLDSSGANKLASLESSMKSFMGILERVNTEQNDVFRTALYPYSEDYNDYYSAIDDAGLITNKVVQPNWGTLTTSEVNSMRTLYGTDSSGALEDAEKDFGLESAVHLAKNKSVDPLKYMIFMSDGSNSQSYECTTEEVWVPGDSEHWIYQKKRQRTRYDTYQNWMNNNRRVTYYPATNDHYEDRDTCSWGYHSDTQSIASCQAMKDAGVTVYSIGYSLIAGANGVSQSDVTRAKDLLESCASSSQHYVLAANAAQLDTVFEKIGAEIVEEVVRVIR